MLVHPAFNTVLQRQFSYATLMDLREDTSAQTTYTFTNCTIDLGGTGSMSGDAASDAFIKNTSRKRIYVIVHGKDDATSYSLSSLTLGGVSGTKVTESGTSGVLVITGLYEFKTDNLKSIANTDIAVTFNEAITGCAIAVISFDNIGLAQGDVYTNTTGTGNMDLNISGSITGFENNAFILVASTCETGGGTESFDCVPGRSNTDQSHMRPFTNLYEFSNVQFDYAAAWSYVPQYQADRAGTNYVRVTWSGTGNGSAVVVSGK